MPIYSNSAWITPSGRVTQDIESSDSATISRYFLVICGKLRDNTANPIYQLFGYSGIEFNAI